MGAAPTYWPWPVDPRGIWTDGTPVLGNRYPSRSILNAPFFREKQAERMAGEVAAAIAWRDAAVEDGWDMRPTYQQEDVATAFTLERGGWKSLGLARPGDPDEPPLPTGSITVWAPDRLQIRVPIVYPGMAVLEHEASFCKECGRYAVQTRRVGFAGRVCVDCHPSAQAAVETPGWND